MDILILNALSWASKHYAYKAFAGICVMKSLLGESEREREIEREGGGEKERENEKRGSAKGRGRVGTRMKSTWFCLDSCNYH